MGKATVLCHTFEHEGRWFCFDSVTSHIYECDEVAAELAPVWNQLADEDVRRTFERKFGKERTQAALAEIRELNASEKALTPKDLTFLTGCSCCEGSALYESAVGHLQMTLTEQCNLRCEYCPYTHNKPGTRFHNNKTMSRETALAAIDFFMARNKDTKIPTISFYGGEPLLQFDLMKEIVARLRSLQRDREVQIHVDTNGVLIDDEVAEYMIKENFYVQISLDGPQWIHDKYRKTAGGGGSYDRVVAGLERLLLLDPKSHTRIRFNAVIAPPYEVKAVIDFFTHFPPYEKMNIFVPPMVGMQFADVSGIKFEPRGQDENSQQKFEREFCEARDQYFAGCFAGKHHEIPRSLRTLFDGEITQYHSRSRDILPDEFIPTGCCRPGQRKVHVKVDGSLMPCERCGDNMIIGHLDSGFDMAMIHTLYEKMVASVSSRCKTCWAVRHCGICFIHMAEDWRADGTGEIVIPDDICERIRAKMEQTFKDYLTLKNGGPEGLAWLKDMNLE